MKSITVAIIWISLHTVMGVHAQNNGIQPPSTVAPQTQINSIQNQTVLQKNYSYVIPHLPSSNTGWKSTIRIFNPATSSLEVIFDVFEVQNNVYSMVYTQTHSLGSKETVSLDSITEQTAGQRWIGVRTDQDLGGDFSFAFNRGDGEEKATLPIIKITENHTTIVFPHIPADRAQFWSGFALVNPHGNSNKVQFKLVGDKGNDKSSLLKPAFENGYNLAAYEKKVSLFEGSVFDDTSSSEKVAWVEVSAERPIVGFELFGKHAAMSLGQLAGIEAKPPQGSNIQSAIPFELGEMDWNGISVVSTSEQDTSMTLKFYAKTGALIRESGFALAGKKKHLGLLTSNGFTFPYGSDSPVVSLSSEEAQNLGAISIHAWENYTVFTLSGKDGEEFDGMSPTNMVASGILALPKVEGNFSLALHSSSGEDDLVAIRVLDSEGEIQYLTQVSLPGHGFAEVPLQSGEQAKSVTFAGKNDLSQIAAYLREHSLEDGHSFSFHNSVYSLNPPSMQTISGEVELPHGVNANSIQIVTPFASSSLGSGSSALSYQVAIDSETVELIAAQDQNENIYALALPGAEISAQWESADNVVLNAESTAIALTCIFPVLGQFPSRDIFSHVVEVVRTVPELVSLTQHLQDRFDQGLPLVSEGDSLLPGLLLEAQMASVAAYEAQLQTAAQKQQSLKSKQYSLLELPGSEFNGLDASFAISGQTPILSLVNGYYRYVALYQVENETVFYELKPEDFVGIVDCANDPVSWQRLITSDLSMKKETTFQNVAVPGNGEFTNFYTLGSGFLEGYQSFYLNKAKHRQIIWPYFWRDLAYNNIAPFLSVVAIGKVNESLVHKIADESMALHNAMYEEFTQNDQLDLLFEDFSAAVGYMYQFTLDYLMANDGLELKRLIRSLEGKGPQGKDGPLVGVFSKLGGLLQTVEIDNSSFNFVGAHSNHWTSSQVSGYQLLAQANPPVIDSFTATPSSIQAGESSVLEWSCSHTDSVTISGVSGSFGAKGSVRVSPHTTTSFALMATGSGGSVMESVTVTVQSTGGTGVLWGTDPLVGKLYFIPAGTFIQGTDTDSCSGRNERPFTHTLTRDLIVMETEVTRQMWQDLAFLQPTLPADPTDTSYGSGMNHPAANILWYEAVLFANLLSLERGLTRCYYKDADFTDPVVFDNHTSGSFYCNFEANGYRLPSEGEWEYMARAGTTGPFSIDEPNYNSSNCERRESGLFPNLESVAWFNATAIDPSGHGESKPVGLKDPNPWGLKDVHGNVVEWCWDWYYQYPSESVTDYTGVSSNSSRVIRGGCWGFNAASCRSARRLSNPPDYRYYINGFRLVRTNR